MVIRLLHNSYTVVIRLYSDERDCLDFCALKISVSSVVEKIWVKKSWLLVPEILGQKNVYLCRVKNRNYNYRQNKL